MLSGQLVLLIFAIGIAIGVMCTLVLHAAAARGRGAMEAAVAPLPDGVLAVLRALEGPAMVLDGSNTVLAATPAAERLGLISDKQLAHAELERMVDAARAAHEPQAADSELLRGTIGPSNLHVSAHAAPLGAGTVLLLVHDRSDSTRLEAVRRDFVANVSHELKTPIGAVGLLAEALQSASDEPEQVRRFAERLTQEAKRLAKITREIIDFSRLQSADPLNAPEIVALDTVLVAAVDQNRVAADARGVELVLAKKTGIHVLGDEALLTTAVHNLIANAVQYSPERGRVGVGARNRDGAAEITVTDQGAGMEPEEVERVFERFYRGDPARSRNTGGTGLGLSIVKHVAQGHGGDVRVWSRTGRGSTFTLRIPSLPTIVPEQPTRRKERERV